MIVPLDKLVKYSDNGSTLSAVNFVGLALPPNDKQRFLHIHHNVPGVLSRINRIVSDAQANIESQILATTPAIGYLVMDLNREASREVRLQTAALDTSIRTRVLY